jgi:hypothetical protein
MTITADMPETSVNGKNSTAFRETPGAAAVLFGGKSHRRAISSNISAGRHEAIHCSLRLVLRGALWRIMLGMCGEGRAGGGATSDSEIAEPPPDGGRARRGQVEMVD